MELNNLKLTVPNKTRKRVGRGPGSGHGKTSCRGSNGAKSRSGPKWYIGLEGGNVPFFRKIPKRGFTHLRRVNYQIVNLRDLEERFEDKAIISPENLFEKNLIKNHLMPVKVLGDGNLTKTFTISAHKFSQKASKLIEEKGGKAECLNL